MKIRELTLTNFKVFEGEKVFQLADRFTVIAGVNGRGKTSVLDALALLLSKILVALDLSSPDGRTLVDSDLHGDTTMTRLSLRANCRGIPVDDFFVSRTRGSRRLRTTRLSGALRRAIVNAYGDPTRSDDEAPLAIYYTTDRAGYRIPTSLPRTIEQGQRIAFWGALISRTVDYRDFLARYRVWKRDPHSREATALKKALGVLLDEFGQVEVFESPPFFLIRKGAKRLTIGQMSDGERSLFALVADLIRRLAIANPQLPDPMKGAGVVLIDELELHLHPSWQRTIVEKLRKSFPNIQFIATTHSPFVIQSLRPGELINLDPEEFVEYSNKSIEDIAEHVMGVALPQKSERYKQMIDVAVEYIRRARSAKPVSDIETELLRQELDELIEPFSDDPAYVALLKLERELALEENLSASRQ